jgi:hypothetical protein
MSIRVAHEKSSSNSYPRFLVSALLLLLLWLTNVGFDVSQPIPQ